MEKVTKRQPSKATQKVYDRIDKTAAMIVKKERLAAKLKMLDAKIENIKAKHGLAIFYSAKVKAEDILKMGI